MDFVHKKQKILVLETDNNMRKDAGMAFTLLFMLIFAITGIKIYFSISVLLLLIAMTYPRIYYYPSILWYTLANILGLISSKVLLSIVFILVVSPIGLLRKLVVKFKASNQIDKNDPMKFSLWKKSNESVFKIRNYKFSKKDLINPY